MGNPIASHDIYCAEKCSMGVNETLNELLICIVMLRQLNSGRFLHLTSIVWPVAFRTRKCSRDCRPIRSASWNFIAKPKRERFQAFLMATLVIGVRTYSENFSKRFDLSCQPPPPGSKPFQPSEILAKASRGVVLRWSNKGNATKV